MKQKLRQKATNQMPDEKNTIQIEKEFAANWLSIFRFVWKKTYGSRDSSVSRLARSTCTPEPAQPAVLYDWVVAFGHLLDDQAREAEVRRFMVSGVY
jgi:hypothetical protein